MTDKSIAKAIVRELFAVMVCAPMFALLSFLLLGNISDMSGNYSYKDKLIFLPLSGIHEQVYVIVNCSDTSDTKFFNQYLGHIG